MLISIVTSHPIVKLIPFDYNSLIIAIIAAVLGVTLDKLWQYCHDKKENEKEELKRELEEKKHKEELNNIKDLIKSECELNLENLKKYDEKYLKLKISRLDSSKNRNEIYLDFYKNLDSFPIFSHDNWDNSINVVNDIFRDEDHIKRIMEFNIKCNMLKEKSIHLHEKSKNKEFVENILKKEYCNEIHEAYSDITDFEWEMSRLISEGEVITNLLNIISIN